MRDLVWKSLQFLFVVLGVSQAQTISCPDVGSDPVELSHDTTHRISYPDPNELCLISKIVAGQIVPVARSYDLNGWHSTAGGVVQGVAVLANTPPDMNSSDIYLPLLDLDEIYQISSHDLSERSAILTDQDLASRFLEQATFGPTMKIIDELLDENHSLNISAFALWVENQIVNEDLTSHREFFRSQVSPQIGENFRPGLKWHPCAAHSLWREYTFSKADQKKYFKLSGNVTENGLYTISFDDHLRTVVDSFTLEDGSQLPPGTYRMCTDNAITPYLNGIVKIEVAGRCKKLAGGNPPIQFPMNDENLLPSKVIEHVDFPGVAPQGFTLLDSIIGDPIVYESNNQITDELCDTISEADFAPIFVNFTSGKWLVHDGRLALKDSTVDEPLSDGGGIDVAKSDTALCSNAPRTFLNSKSCKVSKDLSACGTFQFQESGSFLLDATAILDLYAMTNKYIYAIDGLRADTSPCAPGVVSRWELISDTVCANDLDDASYNRLKNKIQKSGSTHSFLKDVKVREKCDVLSTTPDPNAQDDGIKIKLDNGQCWQHVHEDHMNVYDMTYWTKQNTHPGNQVAANSGNPNPIKKWAKNGQAALEYPSWHPMSRWIDHRHLFEKIGRLGDNVAFVDLPNYLRLELVADHFGIYGTSPSGEGVLVCGSPNEVSNDISLSRELSFSLGGNKNDRHEDDLARQKKRVWATIVLSAKDQLRQKVAWALSQILALTPLQIDSVVETEPYLSFYDIFVRNAFGSYLDILREVSYSPMMSEMLTFLQSKSTAYVWETESSYVFADENYAREIMQLFSVGTSLLNMDGTPKLDPNTNLPIETYSNEEIESLARVWTGFDRQRIRGNIEDYYKTNRLDPMKIIADWRDFFPKINLYGGYIGDGVELCSNLQEQEFLKKGAQYRLLGSSTTPEMHKEFDFDQVKSSKRQLVLDSTSSMLYNELCNSVNGECTFPAEVSISDDLICSSVECDVNSVRIVKVDQMFFEYMRKPCVEFLFYNNAKTIKSLQNSAMCGNPQMTHASEACCDASSLASRNCQYLGERMTYDDATTRCDENQKKLCSPVGIDTASCDECCQDNQDYFWTTEDCGLYLNVDGEGKVAVVHLPAGSHDTPSHVYQDSLNFFRVTWPDGGHFPSLSNNCGDGACQLLDDQCFCAISVQEERIFTNDEEAQRNNLQQILHDHLHIRSNDPATFGPDEYAEPVLLENGVIAHLKNAVNIDYDIDTIFEVNYHGETKFFRNMKSTVTIVQSSGAATDFTFRNPPYFMTLSRAERRDAYYETEAALEHYFHHPNTAPFLALRLIQRFGISNPSPRYIQAVAEAFTDGVYKWNDENGDDPVIFGSSKYGDLAAMCAAILLEPEARSPLLDLDPSFGSLKEPLTKLIGFMRSMEYVSPDRKIVPLRTVMDKIGQMAHDIPSVFSFFLSEYSPSGLIKSASLVSPEAIAYTAPNIIGLLNGMFSLIKWGLSDCEYGFGPDKENTRACRRYKEGVWTKSWGRITFEPPELSETDAVINALAMLLTGGRLSMDRRQEIANAYNNANDNNAGLRLAQQLILTSPEFHSTNLAPLSGAQRDSQSTSRRRKAQAVGSSYKAIVYLLLRGGCDSFNLLVPHSQCSNGKDMYDEYATVRGKIGLNKTDLLEIEDFSSSQVCAKFGLHPQLPRLQALYNTSDALFLANTGHTYKDLNDKYERDNRDPMHSFGHNLQQERVQRVDPFQQVLGTGVLGRIADVVWENGLSVNSFSLGDLSTVLENTIGKSKKQSTVAGDGNIAPFNPRPSSPDMWNSIKALNEATDPMGGLFGEQWSSTMLKSVEENEDLRSALANADTTASFPGSKIGGNLEVISRLIKSRVDRGVHRDVFYLSMSGFDTHSNVLETLEENFGELDEALHAFSEEMKYQGVWDDVVLVSASDFGRTLTPNSKQGTDHAWGGNYFAIGGGLNGRRILGRYPDDLTSDGPLNVGRGRILPTTSWDAVWHGFSQWFGVNLEADLDTVIPNRDEFSHELMLQEDLFSL